MEVIASGSYYGMQTFDQALFGHVKGAFTGAITSRKGYFETANKGTIFFDEIGTISPETQAKLLRVIQEREFMPVGSAETIKVDVRIIAATNAELKRLVDEGKFREDLYYRLNVINLALPPLRDEKILAAWNGLAISAFAVAGRVLGEPRYIDAATRAADFVWNEMRPDGRLVRSWKDGRPGATGFLDDQAFLTAGLIDLYEASFDRRWLQAALDLAAETERRFADPTGGWFMTADDHERLIAREKPIQDGAEPSGTSVALLSALRLHTFTGDESWRTISERALVSLAAPLGENPLALTEALVALDYFTDEAKEIAVIWPHDATAAAARPLLDVLARTFVPNRALAGASEADVPALGRLAPFVADKMALNGRPTAYVCVHGRCDLPVHDPEALTELLIARRR